ncbi:mCG145258, partial [Mus musculus]
GEKLLRFPRISTQSQVSSFLPGFSGKIMLWLIMVFSWSTSSGINIQSENDAILEDIQYVPGKRH